MPRVIDYAAVVQAMNSQGFVSLYYNSGAFGFPERAATRSVGWIGAEDPSIRPAARALARLVPAPVEPALAGLGTRAWLEHLGGPVWVTPKSHWAYELDFGSHEWLPGALRAAGLSAGQVHALAGMHDGAAVEFAACEGREFEPLLLALLRNLFGSDFLLSWPGRPAVCTVHHHRQLWWTTSDEGFFTALEALAPST